MDLQLINEKISPDESIIEASLSKAKIPSINEEVENTLSSNIQNSTEL